MQVAPGLNIVSASNKDDGRCTRACVRACVFVLPACVLHVFTARVTRAAAGEYHELSGTSQAAPHAAGVAALVMSLLPNAPPSQVIGDDDDDGVGGGGDDDGGGGGGGDDDDDDDVDSAALSS